MKPPRFFFGLLLLFWGLQTDSLWLGAAAGIALEWARMLKNGFDLKSSDFNTFIDISTVLLAGTLVTGFVLDAPRAVFMLLKWLPLIFFPIIAAQECSTRGAIDTKAFFLTARRRRRIKTEHGGKTKTIDVGFLYAVLVILSAGSTRNSGLHYSLALALFSGWALYHIRPKRYGPALWACCLLLTFAGGYGGQRLMEKSSEAVAGFMMGYYDRYYGAGSEKSSTAIGELGRLKLSGAVTARVLVDDHTPGMSFLLKDGVYNTFSSPNWFALHAPFTPLAPKSGSSSLQVNPPPASPVHSMTVYFRPNRKKTALLLPNGVVSINELKAEGYEKNRLQTLRIEGAPALAKSRITHTGSIAFASPPSDYDLKIPEQEQEVIATIGLDILPPGVTAAEAGSLLKAYFADNFSYTLTLHGKGDYPTPLQNFLLHTRAGHCELFATATVLLLRDAGIPARYVTGFITHEYSPLTGRYLVRSRDAHAWVQVRQAGRWENLDTTPPSFLQRDAELVDTFLPGDILSHIGFELSRIRHETGAKFLKEHGLWLLLPMLFYLGVRLRKSRHVRWVNTENGRERIQEGPAAELQVLEALLARQGITRRPSESRYRFLMRTAELYGDAELTPCLEQVGALYSRLRYSESGLPPEEEAVFRKHIEAACTLLNRASFPEKEEIIAP